MLVEANIMLRTRNQDGVFNRIDRGASPNINRSIQTSQALAPTSLVDVNDNAQPSPYASGGGGGGNLNMSSFKMLVVHIALSDVSLNITIEHFFGRLKDEKRLPPESIRVIFGGKELTDGSGRTIVHYDIQNPVYGR